MDKNRVILVTGSSRGIGKGLVSYFAELGCKVIINYSKAREEAEKFYRELSAEQGEENLLLVHGDVSAREEVRTIFRKAREKFGAVDVLINNAGINIDRPFLEMKDEEWERVIKTNLTGTFLCSQEFAFQLGDREGHIINLGAATGIHGRKNGVNYCSSKAGIITLTKCLALELAPKVLVNCILPGFIGTGEVVERYDLTDEKKLAAVLSKIPQGRLGTVEDIARTAEYILFGSSFVTGQNFFVNGGDFMH